MGRTGAGSLRLYVVSDSVCRVVRPGGTGGRVGGGGKMRSVGRYARAAAVVVVIVDGDTFAGRARVLAAAARPARPKSSMLTRSCRSSRSTTLPFGWRGRGTCKQVGPNWGTPESQSPGFLMYCSRVIWSGSTRASKRASIETLEPRLLVPVLVDPSAALTGNGGAVHG